jgi:hypothetical protein
VAVGFGLAGVAGVRLARDRRWVPVLGGGALLVLLLIRITVPEQPVARALIDTPWRASTAVLMLLPTAAFWAGVWLAHRWGVQEPRGWLLRWYLAAGALMFLTEYPILDVPHLAWSAGILLVVGAVALEQVHTWLAARWRLAAAGRAALFAALLIVPTLAAFGQLVGWRALYYFEPDEATGVPHIMPLVRLETVRYVEGLWVSPAVRRELTSLLDVLHRTTSPGESIFVYPVSPLVYVLAERPNPTRLEHLYPGTVPREALVRVLESLEQAHVMTVVISDYFYLSDRSRVDNAIVDDYLTTHFQESWRSGPYRILRRVQ